MYFNRSRRAAFRTESKIQKFVDTAENQPLKVSRIADWERSYDLHSSPSCGYETPSTQRPQSSAGCASRPYGGTSQQPGAQGNRCDRGVGVCCARRPCDSRGQQGTASTGSFPSSLRLGTGGNSLGTTCPRRRQFNRFRVLSQSARVIYYKFKYTFIELPRSASVTRVRSRPSSVA